MQNDLLIMRGCTRAGKSVLSSEIGQWPGGVRLEMDAYKRQKYGTPWMCNPDVDFPAVGKLAKAELRRGKSVVVEESFVEKTHVAMLVRWAGFELDSPNVVYVWLELSLEQALARKPDSKFPLERLRAEYARYPNRWVAPNELVIRTADMSADSAIEMIRARVAS
jgi:predicted kinase